MSTSDTSTPMMKQYRRVRAEVPEGVKVGEYFVNERGELKMRGKDENMTPTAIKPELTEAQAERVKAIDEEFVHDIIDPMLAILKSRYSPYPAVGAFLDLLRPYPLLLGVTTPAEIVAAFGEPAERHEEPGNITTIDNFEALKPRPDGLRRATVKGSIERLRYAFTRATMVSLGNQATARIRLLDLSFWNGKLVAYNFSSSFNEDATDFDEAKVGALPRGRTSAGDVLNLLDRKSTRLNSSHRT